MEKETMIQVTRLLLHYLAIIVCTGIINSSPIFRDTTSIFISVFAKISALIALLACSEIFIGIYANEGIVSIHQDRMRNLFRCSVFHIADFLILNFLCDHIVDYINIPINNIFIIFALLCFLIYDFADFFSTHFLIVMSSFYISCENELKKETEKNIIYKKILTRINHFSEKGQKKPHK